MKQKKNIDQIIAFLDKQIKESSKFEIEYCNKCVAFMGNEIQYKIEEEQDDVKLIVLVTDLHCNMEVFHLYESWFRIPQRDQFQRALKEGINNRLLTYWRIMVASDGIGEMLVVGNLMLADYIQALDIMDRDRE